jgi:hypothetical protein
MFAKSSVEKGSHDDFRTKLKNEKQSKESKAKPENCQVFITWHSTSQVLLMRSLLRRK